MNLKLAYGSKLNLVESKLYGIQETMISSQGLSHIFIPVSSLFHHRIERN